MFKGKKVLFNYKSSYLDSVYVFDNGDFILFGVTDKSTNDTSERKSALYDGRTFKPKLSLKMTSVCAFSYLANDKFSICVDNSYFNSYFQLCKFNSDRTSYEEIQKLSSIEGGSAKNVKEMSNGDLCINRVYVGFNNIYIFRKNESNPKYEPYGNTFLYHLEDLNELMNLNEKEALGYKINHAVESLTLKVFDISNYKIKRKNEIKFRDSKLKKRMHISLPIYLINNNKLITAGIKFLYIIGLDNLELETTILFEKFINKILIRPNKNIFLIYESRDEKRFEVKGITNSARFYYDQFINNIKIDFGTNDLIEGKEEEITSYCGNNKGLFEIYNYINNGIITLTDKSEITIYKDCGD